MSKRSDPGAAELVARLQAAPPSQRGAVLLVLWLNAVVSTVLYPLLAVWLAVTARRVWRRRGEGVRPALAHGVHRPALVVAATAVVGHQTYRRRFLAELRRGLPPA